ncbi:hypothetical protein [Alicyclobacillus kakegawensis]|uniref:hypothetical protein n=1 Tax=Alicyclobacillus kakegawensis TaxID=392012 RepID=UPI000830B416|nr:hypothetical protein [Alicyclobacillus kakegawensis]
MTTRFSLSELAQMLQAPVEVVRQAVDDLADHGELTAESFVFGDRNWRVAPSDVKRVQDWIAEHGAKGETGNRKPVRRVRRKVVRQADTACD